MIIRFDDICYGADMKLVNEMVDHLQKKIKEVKIIWACSPIVSSDSIHQQRVFPKEWNALSDYKIHYTLDLMGHPVTRKGIEIASHGLIHVDHRLLHRSAQELSILLSCSILDCKMFVPPFNKWNKDTEDICRENDIQLIKFEQGWKSMEYNNYDHKTKFWYLHAREWNMKTFKAWLG